MLIIKQLVGEIIYFNHKTTMQIESIQRDKITFKVILSNGEQELHRRCVNQVFSFGKQFSIRIYDIKGEKVTLVIESTNLVIQHGSRKKFIC